jgi:hypothetical protein
VSRLLLTPLRQNRSGAYSPRLSRPRDQLLTPDHAACLDTCPQTRYKQSSRDTRLARTPANSHHSSASPHLAFFGYSTEMESTSADEVTDRGTPPRAIRLRHVTAACWTHPLVYSANGLAHACRSSRRRHRTHLRGAACRQQKASTAARIGGPRSSTRPLLLAAGDRINVSVCDTGASRMPAIAGDFRAGTISTGRVSGGPLGHERQMAETRFPLISAIWLVAGTGFEPVTSGL